MSSPRIRRLQLDYQRLQERFEASELIQLIEATGNPPENYQIRFTVKGLVVGPDGEIRERNEHLVGINLTLDYPRRAPQCKIIGPIFHPNFDANTICIGDFWAASEGLDDLIIRIGRMIAYQEYNTKSPLNGLAAKWAAENASLLPVDTREIAPPLPTGEGPEEGAAITLLGQFASEDENDAVSGAPTGSNAPPQLPARGAGAWDDGGAWAGRIVIGFDASPPSETEHIAPPLDATRREAGRVLRLSPGLCVDELKVSCTTCGQSMLIGVALFGEAFQCPNCNRTHRVAEDGAI
jgi:ubiquitin-protein ligase